MQDVLRGTAVNCTVVPVSLKSEGSLIARVVWQQTVLPRVLRRFRIDILIAPTDLAPLRPGRRLLLGIQNANPYWGPPATTWRGRRRDQFLRYLTRLSAWRARRIFFVSEWSRQVISAQLQLPLSKSRAIHHGVSEVFRQVGRERATSGGSSADGHVLVVASVRSHRDFPTLFHAWQRLVQQAGTRKLLIAGPILERAYYRRLTSLLHELQIGHLVSFLSVVPNDAMLDLYRLSAALVFPSFGESFGLPLVEAMACHVPVIASDIPITREICDDAACYYRLGDADDLAGKLLQVLGDQEVRTMLTSAGSRRVQHFTWQGAARQMRELLWEACQDYG